MIFPNPKAMKHLMGQPLLLRKGIRSAEVEPLRQETAAGMLASGLA
ncbi:hypothetical protein [Erwinia sp. SLM-02]